MSDVITLNQKTDVATLTNRIIYQDTLDCLEYLPDSFIDLLIVDPPYNMTKKFGSHTFSKTSNTEYEEWLETWVAKITRSLKSTASIYVCCDWSSSKAVQTVLEKHFTVRNRITWEREKGRGSKTNWKNCSEDIWFCTMSDDYVFHVDAVKTQRKVLAPYKNKDGIPKDWSDGPNGKHRLTYPSNLWTDISVPFWSMPENTNHPTQKPEKLIAKLILASSMPDDFVFDPFVGSGTTCVTAKKLGRRFSGIEREPEYCQLSVQRLIAATTHSRIQGYTGEFFLDRNS